MVLDQQQHHCLHCEVIAQIKFEWHERKLFQIKYKLRRLHEQTKMMVQMTEVRRVKNWIISGWYIVYFDFARVKFNSMKITWFFSLWNIILKYCEWKKMKKYTKRSFDHPFEVHANRANVLIFKSCRFYYGIWKTIYRLISNNKHTNHISKFCLKIRSVIYLFHN